MQCCFFFFFHHSPRCIALTLARRDTGIKLISLHSSLFGQPYWLSTDVQRFQAFGNSLMSKMCQNDAFSDIIAFCLILSTLSLDARSPLYSVGLCTSSDVLCATFISSGTKACRGEPRSPSQQGGPILLLLLHHLQRTRQRTRPRQRQR